MDEHPKNAHAGAREAYDSELDLRSIIGFSVGVIVVTIVAAAIMWWMSVTFKQREEAKDRAPSPLAEARVDLIPPGPRLQPAPPRDMEELAARDKEALTTYGWIDPAHGIARIPVDRAMSILAEKGAGAK
jgi:hypothetical protein